MQCQRRCRAQCLNQFSMVWEISVLPSAIKVNNKLFPLKNEELFRSEEKQQKMVFNRDIFIPCIFGGKKLGNPNSFTCMNGLCASLYMCV